MKKNILFLFAILLSFTTLYGQSADEQLAAHYFNNGEFNKASIYYEKLYKNKPATSYYNNLVDCYIELNQYDKAEILIKDNKKKFKTDPKYSIDLGKVYYLQNEPEKGKKEYDYALKILPKNQIIIKNTAKAFIEIKEYDYAEKVYNKGSKLLNGNYLFNLEKADLKGLQGDTEGMLTEYINLLEKYPNYENYIKRTIERYINLQEDNKNAEIFKQKLIEKIQSKNNTSTINLLVWLFIQRREFNQAYIQIKAIDKRNKRDGYLVYNLGEICIENKSFDVATKCFKYVTESYPDGTLFFAAKEKLLEVQQEQLNYGVGTQELIFSLRNQYESLIKDYGYNKETAITIKNYAHLQAFYLHNLDSAVLIIDTLLNKTPGLTKSQIGKIKMELADIYLLDGDIWEANIYYKQVEKDFKQDVLGQTAKYKAAKVSYYAGDFEWAQTQLDVLKASTSKLIANDALFLSLLISDNLNEDSNSLALLQYAKADLFIYQNLFDSALYILDQIILNYPLHKLEDEVYFSQYKISILQGDYFNSEKYLLKIEQNNAKDILGDQAIYLLGELYLNNLNNKPKAKEYFEKIILHYPGSVYLEDSRKKYRILKKELEK